MRLILTGTLGVFWLLVVVFGDQLGHLSNGVVNGQNHAAELHRLKSLSQKLRLHKRETRVSTFKYNNCGNPNQEIANITRLVIGPDPITFPGPLTVDFGGVAKTQVASPIPVALVIQTKVGNNWVKIPCIGQIGSCNYDDICELLEQIPECPAPLVNAGIPCKCPFRQGVYNLPQAVFEVDVPFFPAGDYHVVANITNGNNLVGCVELYVTFA